jgi:hypothetical protein
MEVHQMNELLKFAHDNDLTEDDLEYLFEQGLEKIAEEQETEILYDAFEKVAEAYDMSPEDLNQLVQIGQEAVALHEQTNEAQDDDELGNEEKLQLVEELQEARRDLLLRAAAEAELAEAMAEEGVEKTASAYLSDEEIEYIFEQGLEKIAADGGFLDAAKNQASRAWQSAKGGARRAGGAIRGGAGKAGGAARALWANPKARLGVGIGAAAAGLAAGGAYALKRRKNLEKSAGLNFTDEEIEYIIAQGLEKVASLADQRRLDGAGFGAEARLRLAEALGKIRSGGSALWANPKVRLGLGLGAAAGIGAGTAYGLKKRKTNREKTAGVDLTDEEIEYIVAQGLEKVASDLGLE